MKLVLSLLISSVLILSINGYNNDDILTYKEASKIIKDYVASQPSIGRDLCDKYTCCTLSDDEKCNIDTFITDSSTLVLPGGESRCIFSSSTPYAFQVIPGASDKLIVYLQGGGACWDEASTNAGFCSTSVSPASLIGMFDRENELNPYKDYTVVHALYCSGDLWGGNVTQSYNDADGVPVTQKGLYNVQLTIDWIIAQQKASKLSSTFTDLIVTGTSAGAVGVQLWYTQILDSFDWDSAVVIPDSYAGVFPDGTQGPLTKALGYCTWEKLPEDLYTTCINEQVTLELLTSYNLKNNYPDVPVAFIQSKLDATQQSFYVAVGYSMNASAVITPTQFYKEVNEIFADYNQYPNFVSYLVDGTQHCFIDKSYYFTADGLGPSDNNSVDNTDITLIEWINYFPVIDSEEVVHSVCVGDITIGLSAGKNDNTYCSSSVYPKILTV